MSLESFAEEDILDESLLEESTIEDTDKDLNIDLSEFKVSNTLDYCLHRHTVKDGNTEKCEDCGLELYQELSLEPEWRYYDENKQSDPARCHIRKDETKNIYADLKDYGLSKQVIKEANDLYLMVTHGQIHRANLRKSIIYACVFNAYKYLQDNNIPDDLQERFGLKKKEISRGLKNFHMNIQKRRKPTYISPSIYINKIMKLFNAGEVHIQRIEKMYELIQNKSTAVSRCNPQSVICGLIFYYWKLLSITNTGYDISCAKFSSMVKLSEITVNRVAKVISKLLGTLEEVKLS